MSFDLAHNLELFFGDAHPAETRVYARLPGTACSSGLTLSGTLTGPFCRYAQTLPATIPLHDCGSGPSVLAHAIVPDPCFWTPELPYLYRARVELRRGHEVLEVAERPLGIRPLGCRGGRFYYEGKPWVLRGAYREHASRHELSISRQADAALFIENPTDELCDAASQDGVLLLARLSTTVSHRPENVGRLARHAAVGFLVFHGDIGAFNPRTVAPNVVVVEEANVPGPPRSQHFMATLLHLNSGDCFLAHIAQTSLPIIAYRGALAARSIVESRKLCDVLQRELAGIGEAAGFLV